MVLLPCVFLFEIIIFSWSFFTLFILVSYEIDWSFLSAREYRIKTRPYQVLFFSIIINEFISFTEFQINSLDFIFSNYGQTFLIPCFTSHKLVFYLMIYSCYRLYQTHNGLGHKYLILVNLQYLLEVHAL